MKIAIDSRWIFEKISGIGKYTETLIAALSELDSENEYFLIFQKKELLDRTVSNLGLKNKKNFHPLLISYGIFSLKNQFFLPFKLTSLNIDIFHSTNFMIPLFLKTKAIVTLHDIILIHSPHFSPRSKKSKYFFIYKWLSKSIAKRANLIFTDSKHSKQDIINHLKVTAEKIKTIYMGIDERFFSLKDTSAEEKTNIRREFNLSAEKVILFVGRSDPYKNLAVLIQAFAELKEIKPELAAKLIIIGEKDNRYPEATDEVRKRNLQNSILFTGYINEQDLFSYFKIADVLVLPSLYEGFGLPAIEAMASGIPVICSNVTSLPEVVSDAGILLDPHNPHLWTQNLIQLLTNESIRTKMTLKGLQRAKQFTSQKMASAVLGYYKTHN